MTMWVCAECGADFEIPKDIVVGELVACGECGVEYEIVDKNPYELRIFEEDEK